MSCVQTSPPGCTSAAPNCPQCDGCIPGVCPNFIIKRGDTKPVFRVSVEDENGPIDLTGLVIEANMWADAKLKTNIVALDTSLALADNIGFCQILPNDIILVNNVRSPEQMRIVGFDEVGSLVFVERGYNGTTPQAWKKGTPLRIFRIINGAALSEMVYDNITQVDGSVQCNVLIESDLIYEWSVNDTCAAGCFHFEFKVLKMSPPVIVPSVATLCFLGIGVEWTRRFPNCGDWWIQICDTPTTETYTQPSTT